MNKPDVEKCGWVIMVIINVMMERPIMTIAIMQVRSDNWGITAGDVVH